MAIIQTAKQAVRDYAVRRDIKKNAKAEAKGIYNKLNQKGDYKGTAFAADQNKGGYSYKGLAKRVLKTPVNMVKIAVAGGVANPNAPALRNAAKAKIRSNAMEKTAKKAMTKQVTDTRMRQYDDNQKKMASKMGVSLQ